MTSEERREARYQRRKAEREAKKQDRNENCGCFEAVFSYDNMYDAYKQTRKGVLWKSSVQTYKANALANVYKTRVELLSGRYKSRGFTEFDLVERGKPRHIKSVHISERVVQRCLCDNCLTPLLSSSFIHDNGASLKGKGIDFALDRLERHLHEHYRRHGTEGYALLFDFSKYFDTARHKPIFDEYRRCIRDERLIAQAEYFVDRFGPEGLGLGSQVSQISALALPNSLDHHIKEKLHIRHYARYMDDGYLLHESKEYLRRCMEDIHERCAALGIALHPTKTRIVKLSRGFTFLKTRFFLTDSGKVVRKIDPGSVARMRRKLKKFREWVDRGKMAMEDVATSYQSWRGYAKRFDAYRTLKSMDALYSELFIQREE